MTHQGVAINVPNIPGCLGRFVEYSHIQGDKRYAHDILIGTEAISLCRILERIEETRADMLTYILRKGLVPKLGKDLTRVALSFI